jgi:cyclic pyranopterin phosphate synthase
MDKKEFTHLTEDGVHMVEVGDKPLQRRIAIASGKIHLHKDTIKMIENAEIKKGNVLTTAQVAGINAVKNTSNLIPLCHPLSISGVEINFEIEEEDITTTVSVKTIGQTGVEMEAITGVSVVLLTIWDMVKAVEKDDNGQYPDTEISNICVLKKEKI